MLSKRFRRTASRERRNSPGPRERATLIVVMLCSVVLGSLPADARAQSTDGELRAPQAEIRSRAEAVEMGDQRPQREILRGPFREETERSRDAEEPATDGFEPRGADEYD
jgi:hypothetical protein